MRLKLWGVRGSLPAPATPEKLRYRLEAALKQFERIKDQGLKMTAAQFIDTLPAHLTGGYGGNTACGEITRGDSRLLIDAGSGLRAFSDTVARQEGADEYHIFFTHFHWDHLIGLPFFAPLYTKGKTVHCYAVQEDLPDVLERLFHRPNFPVPFKVIEKQLKVHRLNAREKVTIGDIAFTPFELDHPDPCWGPRVEGGGKSIAWCVDTEATRVTREELGPDLPLYTNADLMVFDAQYSFSEALEKRNWGHSSGPTGIDIALRENVKRALFMHHDPGADCEMIAEAEDQTRRYFDELMKARRTSGLTIPDLHWRFAREGDVVEL